MAAEVRPYVGPRPFEESDRLFFFGRGDEAQHIVSLIVAHPVVLLHARSGAGKSSLVNADVIPRLRHLAIEGRDPPADSDEGAITEIIGPMRVSGQVPKGTAANMNVFANSALFTLQGADGGAASISEYLAALPAHSSNAAALRVLIFDQFEELFTHFEDRWRDRGAFVDDLGNALDADRRLRVLLVMREEFLAGIDTYATRLPERARSRFRLEPLKRPAAMLAVQGPLTKTGRRFAPEAAEKLVSQLLQLPAPGGVRHIEGEFIEPLHLQVVCQNIWESLPPKTQVITEDLITSHGNVEEALARHYELSLGKAVAAGAAEGELRRWFERMMITPNETRGLAYRDHQSTGGLDNRYVDILEHAYLLRNELRGGMAWYELSHDRFVGPILRANQQWRKRVEHGETTRERYESRAAEWMDGDRSASLLLTAPELAEIVEWQKTPAAAELGLSPALSELIQRSETAAARAGELASLAEARRLKSQRAMIIALTAVVLVVAGIALLAVTSAAKTQTQLAQWTVERANAEAKAKADENARAIREDAKLRMAVQEAALRAKSSTMRETLGSMSGNLATREQEFLALALGVRAVVDPSGGTDPTAADALRRALRAVSNSQWLSAPEKQVQRSDITEDGRYALIVTSGPLLVYNLADSTLPPKRITPPEGRRFTYAFIEAGRWIVAKSESDSGSASSERTEFSYYDLVTGLERTALTTQARVAYFVETDPSGRYIDMMKNRRFVRIDTQSEDKSTQSDFLINDVAEFESNYAVNFSRDGKFALIVRDADYAPEVSGRETEPATGTTREQAGEEANTDNLESLPESIPEEKLNEELPKTDAILVDLRSMTLRSFPFREEQASSYDLEFSADSESVAIARNDADSQIVSFWRVGDGTRIGPDITIPRPSKYIFDGREFLVITDDDATVWNVANNRKVRHNKMPRGSRIITKNTGIVLFRQEKDPYTSVFSWNASTGQIIGRINGLKTVDDGDINGDGTVFLVTRGDGMSRIWDTQRCPAAQGGHACNANESESTFANLSETALVGLACHELRTRGDDLYRDVKDRCSAVTSADAARNGRP